MNIIIKEYGKIKGATGHKSLPKIPTQNNMIVTKIAKCQTKLKRAWSNKTVAWKMQLVANVVALTLDAVCLCITGDVSCFVTIILF